MEMVNMVPKSFFYEVRTKKFHCQHDDEKLPTSEEDSRVKIVIELKEKHRSMARFIDGSSIDIGEEVSSSAVLNSFILMLPELFIQRRSRCRLWDLILAGISEEVRLEVGWRMTSIIRLIRSTARRLGIEGNYKNLLMTAEIELVKVDVYNEREVLNQALRESKRMKREIYSGDNSEENSTDRCMICLEKFTAGMEILRLPCGHFFDGDCIIEWYKNKSTCPICRFQLPTD